MLNILDLSKSRCQLQSNTLLFIAGCLSALGFAPFKLYLVTFFAYGYLYCQSDRNCFWFFLGQTIFACHWLFFSIKNYGMLPSLQAIIITLFACAMIATLPALSLRFVRRKKLLLWPLWLTACEFIRSYWLFSGFPWLLLSYSQIDAPGAVWFPIIGVHGTSLVLAYVIAYTTHAAIENSKLHFIPGLLFIISCLLLPKNWTKPNGIELSFATKPTSLVNIYDIASETPAVDFVLWPEGALHHILNNYEHNLLQNTQHKSLIIFGGLSQQHGKIFNSALAVSSSGKISHHDKYNLVAFGEYWPLKKLYAQIFNTPEDFSSALTNNNKLIAIKNTFILPIICYDIAFSKWMLPEVVKSGLFVSIHQMRWFASNFATMQQLEFAKARSLEFGRAQVFLEPKLGHIVINPDGSSSRKNKIHVYQGITPYTKLLLYLLHLS